MITQKNTLTLGFALLLAAAAPCFAQTHNNALHPVASEPQEFVAAEAVAAAPEAIASPYGTQYKLALSYAFGSKVRSKNVKSVSNPSPGVICIESSVSLNLKEIYPLVSIEWGESLGNSLLAFWRDTSLETDCKTGWLEVQTFDFGAGGAPIASNNVAFDLVIQ